MARFARQHRHIEIDNDSLIGDEPGIPGLIRQIGGLRMKTLSELPNDVGKELLVGAIDDAEADMIVIGGIGFVDLDNNARLSTFRRCGGLGSDR